jgi:iron-sulfur cluster repair protein YtfE (RIC family)
MTLRHGEARALLVAQHAEIDELLHQMQAAAAEVTLAQVDPPAARRKLVAAVSTLREKLCAHMETEEALLAPILESRVEQGPLRLGLLRTEHASQRALLDVLVSVAAIERDPQAIGWRLEWLARDLRFDMKVEERELFARVLDESEQHEGSSP